MDKVLGIEEIRKKHGYNQTEWARLIGSTLRTYQGRLDGSQPTWKLDEIIKAAEYNDGEIVIDNVIINVKRVDS